MLEANDHHIPTTLTDALRSVTRGLQSHRENKEVQPEGKLPPSTTCSPTVLRFQIWDPSGEADQPTVAATRAQSER